MAIKCRTDQVWFLRQYLGGWRSGEVVNSISDGDVNAWYDEYESCYTMTPATQIHGEKRQNVLEAARIERG